MSEHLDMMERLSAILSRTADLNRWCLRVCETGGVTEDMRRDMVSAAEQIIRSAALLGSRK
jgi:hypothetical protein